MSPAKVWVVGRLGRSIDTTRSAVRCISNGQDLVAGPVAELDANGNTLTTFVYGTGINAPDYMVRGAETFAMIRDHLGSVRFVLNTADNAIAQELRYDPFGQVVLDTNPGFQPFGYAGGLYDPDTELTRFGARDYEAHTGRWTARDPIAFGGGQTNLYVYVGSDPINFVDPDGAIAIPAILGGIWAAIEFGLLIYDIYEMLDTLTNPCSSTTDKLLSVGGVIASGVLPGGGYGTGAKLVHGNSRWSQRATHVYEIRNLDTWEVVKTGISSGPISKKGKSYRAEFQRRRWGSDQYETTIIADIPTGPGARQRALQIEKANADGLRASNNLSDDFFHKRP